jgi:hypothetical protein
MLLWKKEVKIDLLFSALKYIDVRVDEGPNKVWRLTVIYGEPRWEDKYKTWDKMRELKSNSDLPWVILGDFSEILFSTEKEGGNPRPPSYMQAFRDALLDCELEDLGYMGEQFTWKRGRIRERLDRVVATSTWCTMHPGAAVQHLGYIKSDHRPICLDTEYQPPLQTSGGPKQFEAKWLREAGFCDTVLHAWDTAGASMDGGVHAKLAHMHGSLHAWDKAVLKKPKRRLRRAQQKLEKVLNGTMSDENDIIAKEMADLVELLLEQEEIHWLQRSRANWLQFGDRNTSFFHNFALA